MDQLDYTTTAESRKRGQHLTLDERGQIEALRKKGLTLREIGEAIGCAHTTVMYELRRGTPEKKSCKGRPPIYKAKRGQKAYEENRKRCRRPIKIASNDTEAFIQWVVRQYRERRWTFGASVGYAKRHRLFPKESMVCAKTLYNMLWKGELPLTVFDMPHTVGRKKKRKWVRRNKRILGASIEERPEEVVERKEFGHWEIDTVVGRKQGRESVVLTLAERTTDNYIAIKIPAKTKDGVKLAMAGLREQFGSKFGEVVKTITADNGTEFEGLPELVEAWGTKVYFAHPYSSFEKPVNERHNGMLRSYIPKGKSIEDYTDEEILTFADEINGLPRRRLGYHTPEELFDKYLDEIYAA